MKVDVEPLMMMANLTFGLIWIFIGSAAVIIVLSIYRLLTKREEVSMVSFLLNPKETAKEIRILHYLCIIAFIGFLASFPSLYFDFIGELLLGFVFGVTTMSAATVFAFLFTLVVFRWWRRFRKYG